MLASRARPSVGRAMFNAVLPTMTTMRLVQRTARVHQRRAYTFGSMPWIVSTAIAFVSIVGPPGIGTTRPITLRPRAVFQRDACHIDVDLGKGVANPLPLRSDGSDQE